MLTALENYCEIDPLTGAVICGHPGIGLHDKLVSSRVGLSIIQENLGLITFFLSHVSEGKKTIFSQVPGDAIRLFDSGGLYCFTGTST